jgi:hypothetical protein
LEEDFVLDETQTTLCKPKSIPSTAQEESTLEFSDNIRFNSLAETSMAFESKLKETVVSMIVAPIMLKALLFSRENEE